MKNKELNEKIEKGEPVEFAIESLNDQTRRRLNYIVMKYLAAIERIYFLNPVITVFNELIDNSVRANVKRLMFQKQKLDISKPEEYHTGMKKFSSTTHGEKNRYEKELEGSGYNTRIRFEIITSGLQISMINRFNILDSEMERIKDRFEKGSADKNFLEVQKEISDDSEGAGMGIALSIFMLKSIGLGADEIKIFNSGPVSITTLTIPAHTLPHEVADEIKKKISEEVDLIPTFPESVQRLKKMCVDPTVSIDEISEIIQRDPALTADVVKISNTAKFIKGKRSYSVSDALMTIGLKRFNEILMAISSRHILNGRYANMESIWEHCNRVALYAQYIARDYGLKASEDEVMIAGLLHDMGRVVFAALAPELSARISRLTHNRKNLSATSLEEGALGVSHAAIGGLIASKWNFPDYLIEAIQHHHTPFLADELFRDIVYCVYLANMFCGIEERQYEYYYIEYAVLLRFRLTDQDALEAYHEKMRGECAAQTE